MLLPIGDANHQRRSRPIVVPLIAVACGAVWLLQLSRGEAFSYGWATVPYEITTGEDLVGKALVTIDGQRAVIHQYPGPTPIHLTLLSAMFMHGSWGHLLGNLLYLLIFADQIEDRLGRLRFLVFYLLCGLAAGLAQVAWSPRSPIPCLGASGAIAGALGAYLVTHPRNPVHVLVLIQVVALPAWLVLGLWIVLQVFSQVSSPAAEASGVAYLAHIGGFVAGVILVFLMTPRANRGR